MAWTAGWAVVACAATAVAAPSSASVPSGWVWWVHTDPSHQRSSPGTWYGSGYQPEGGKSMWKG